MEDARDAALEVHMTLAIIDVTGSATTLVITAGTEVFHDTWPSVLAHTCLWTQKVRLIIAVTLLSWRQTTNPSTSRPPASPQRPTLLCHNSGVPCHHQPFHDTLLFFATTLHRLRQTVLGSARHCIRAKRHLKCSFVIFTHHEPIRSPPCTRTSVSIIALSLKLHWKGLSYLTRCYVDIRDLQWLTRPGSRVFAARRSIEVCC